jgi:hypothetical protein
VTGPDVGHAAPPLSGTTATGEPYDLASPRAKSVLVEFHRGTW